METRAKAQMMLDNSLLTTGARGSGDATTRRVVDIEVPVLSAVARISVLAVASGLGEDFRQMGWYSDARQFEMGCFGLKPSL